MNRNVYRTYYYIFVGAIILAVVLTGLFFLSKLMPEDPYATGLQTYYWSVR